jgi:hypothetical protein
MIKVNKKITQIAGIVAFSATSLYLILIKITFNKLDQESIIHEVIDIAILLSIINAFAFSSGSLLEVFNRKHGQLQSKVYWRKLLFYSAPFLLILFTALGLLVAEVITELW